MIEFFASLLLASPTSEPSATEGVYPSDCMAKQVEPELASAMADDNLAVNGAGREANENQLEAAHKAHFACVLLHDVPEAKQFDFWLANMSAMVGIELRRRLASTGIDLEVGERLAEAFLKNPDLDLPEYVAENSEEFSAGVGKVIVERGLSADEIYPTLFSFAVARSQQISAERKLAAP